MTLKITKNTNKLVIQKSEAGKLILIKPFRKSKIMRNLSVKIKLQIQKNN